MKSRQFLLCHGPLKFGIRHKIKGAPPETQSRGRQGICRIYPLLWGHKESRNDIFEWTNTLFTDFVQQIGLKST